VAIAKLFVGFADLPWLIFQGIGLLKIYGRSPSFFQALLICRD
jgi:hypothetical protein